MWLKRYSNKFILPEINKRKDNIFLLDIGCGTGNLIPYLPENINYMGIDYSQNYNH